MKNPILIAISILALLCGGLYYHMNVMAKFETLESQTLSGQLESVKSEARRLEKEKQEFTVEIAKVAELKKYAGYSKDKQESVGHYINLAKKVIYK